MKIEDIVIDNEIDVLLSPKNEADYPEQVKVKLLQQIPSEMTQVFIAELLQQTKQDFGYHVGELLIIKITIEEDSILAVCTESLHEASMI